MAELAIVASVIGIVGTGTKLSLAIFDFAASVGNAGRELQHAASEITDLCSVLKQLQMLLEHAHFQPSKTAIEAAQRIIGQCSKVFIEIDEIVSDLRRAKGDDLFPSVDFVSKVKWTFSKKSKVLVLRSTLEACKSTLSVMLTTLLLAERVSQRRHSGVTTLVEEEQDQAVTQSLVIAQQCAVEQLERYEDEVEKEEDAAMRLPDLNHAVIRPDMQARRKSRARLFQMFSGPSLVTDLPTPMVASVPTVPKPPTRAERASLWLDAILSPPDEPFDIHLGRARYKRLSSVGTEDAPFQLLRKWTDQAGFLKHRDQPVTVVSVAEPDELWRDSKFSFPISKLSNVDENVVELIEPNPTNGVLKTHFDPVSPKTTRAQSIGYDVVVGVDRVLEPSNNTIMNTEANDSYDSISRAILREYCASADIEDVELGISYGGKMKMLERSDKPIEVLRNFQELELSPRLVIRRIQLQPP